MSLLTIKPDTDELLERRIDGESLSMQCCEALGNKQDAMLHWLELCWLVKHRSGRKVAQLERERGFA